MQADGYYTAGLESMLSRYSVSNWRQIISANSSAGDPCENCGRSLLKWGLDIFATVDVHDIGLVVVNKVCDVFNPVSGASKVSVLLQSAKPFRPRAGCGLDLIGVRNNFRPGLSSIV